VGLRPSASTKTAIEEWAAKQVEVSNTNRTVISDDHGGEARKWPNDSGKRLSDKQSDRTRSRVSDQQGQHRAEQESAACIRALIDYFA
jgi:hypothetical protein